LGAVYIPSIALVLKVVPPDFIGWAIIIGMSLVPLLIGQTIKYLMQKNSATETLE